MIQDLEWSFRDELFAATHRWYVIVLCCLAGGALGWLMSWIWPSPFQASKELFVGLNVSPSAGQQAASGASGPPVVSANDYKNWQMASLNTVIFTDAIIGETLTRLRALDPYWNSVSQEQLTERLRVYWRNAGKWRLVVEDENPLHAGDAVVMWESVVVERVHQAVEQSQEARRLDLKLQASSAALAQTDARLAALNQQNNLVKAWRGRLAALPPADAVGAPVRVELQGLFLSLDPGAETAPQENTFPAADRPVADYAAWLAQAQTTLDKEIDTATAQRRAQIETSAQLSEQYSRAVSASLGLAPELIVQKLSDRKLRLSILRPTGQAILIGAALGWIAWALIWLARPALRAGV